MEFLLDKGLIEPSPSSTLDAAYRKSSILTTKEDVESDSATAKSGPKERMLLSLEDGRVIAESIGVPEIEVEITRAVQQVQQTLKAQKDLQDERKHLDVAASAEKTKP